MLLKIETAKPIKEGCYLGIQSGSSRCFTRGDDGPYAQRLPKNFALFLLACSIFCTLFSLSLRAQYYRTREREEETERKEMLFSPSLPDSANFLAHSVSSSSSSSSTAGRSRRHSHCAYPWTHPIFPHFLFFLGK